MYSIISINLAFLVEAFGFIEELCALSMGGSRSGRPACAFDRSGSISAIFR